MSVTFDSASAVAVTLSNGNLTATNTGTTATNQGAKAVAAKTSGKWYFEATLTTKSGAGGADLSCGVAINTDTFTDAGFNVANATMLFVGSGNIWTNTANSGLTLGARAQGDVIGIAVDMDNKKLWFRVAPSGNWNGSSSLDPATNVGGIAVTSSAGGVEPFVAFGGTNGTSSNAWTANFGATAFSGTVPSGFSAWQSGAVIVLPPNLFNIGAL